MLSDSRSKASSGRVESGQDQARLSTWLNSQEKEYKMAGTMAILIARLIFGGAFLLATMMKFSGMDDTAAAINSIGFPFPLFFAWIAAFFELGLVLAFLSGAFFREAAGFAAAYVLFLGFAF